MNRFNELLEKRKNLKADIFEEEELIELSEKMTNEQLKDIDKNLLTYSNSDRLRNMSDIIDRINEILNKN